VSNSLFDKTTNSLGAAINFRLLRNNVVSSNIANAETPGYKAKKVDFEDALSRAIDINGLNRLKTDNPKQFISGAGEKGEVEPDVYDNPDVNVSNDGNTVDMEKEMSKLAENTILYKAALRLINKKLAALKYVTAEGGR